MARILVVDDSSIMRRNLSAILKKEGHTIVGEAANGELAYIEYGKLKPDLVTMDITMPIMDGIGAVKRIIQAHPNANIIMISALDQKFMVLSALQCGAKHYILKPFAAEKVIQIVNTVLKSTDQTSSNPGKAINHIDSTINNIKTSIKSIDTSIDKLDNLE